MAAHDELIGKTVAGKYRVESMLGEGGMGKVYKANQLALDKHVVLKVLRQALLSDERTVARFQREAKAASRLNHPNSISVLDFGQAEDGAMYIAMEYVHGKDLHGILSKEWPLPEARVVRIMSQVLSALSDAHSAGVIHRDLKPENIMVEQRRGEADFVKVLDFGIAKIVDGTNEDGPALTRAGFVCGTPEYMSPEQARGAQLDHRSDLYAVGVILYQLMAGMLPFDSDSAVGFATKHLTEVPQPPSKRRPDAKISAAMERLILRAMAKNPDERPATAEQFRAELLAIDKERRAGSSNPKLGRGGSSSAALSQVPQRKVTPIDQQDTRVTVPPTNSNPWAADDPTRRTDSAQRRAQAMASDGGPTVATAIPPDLLHEGGGKAATAFKVATVALVLLAVGLAGAYGYQLLAQPKDVFAPQHDGPLYELQLTAEQRRTGDSVRVSQEGDAAFAQGNLDFALVRYEEAWKADPSPELALKLGELHYQLRHLDQAKLWWLRYKKDAPGGKGLAYIEQVLPLP